MGRSLYTKLVLIIMTLIVAFMVVVGAFLLHGVRSFYLNQFYEGMQTVFANEELADSLRAAADSDQAAGYRFREPELLYPGREDRGVSHREQ